MDPYLEIDIPLLERLIAERKKTARRACWIDPGRIGDFFAMVKKYAKNRDELERLRQAINTINSILGPDRPCILYHCPHWFSRAVGYCGKGRSTGRCKRVKAYLAKKAANFAECATCQHRSALGWTSRSGIAIQLCGVKRHADRPDECPRKPKGER
ncbi:MAG: hypothetical protein AB7E47_12930 [Desulfovibrionaceae bacterium]